ncbi:UNKNOWN [Stylonychia lemnae]|uniref:Uncharacterized protein n=1 Tax=Stylonychia lemnae TaxID=5949 RepID=A0A078AED9_STYLE|nr:UNKNOWN [Stylonychia lemnae]|eukprot:CDW80629.1 UNKNOWN [Stylonychia lemnae]
MAQYAKGVDISFEESSSIEADTQIAIKNDKRALDKPIYPDSIVLKIDVSLVCSNDDYFKSFFRKIKNAVNIIARSISPRTITVSQLIRDFVSTKFLELMQSLQSGDGYEVNSIHITITECSIINNKLDENLPKTLLKQMANTKNESLLINLSQHDSFLDEINVYFVIF